MGRFLRAESLLPLLVFLPVALACGEAPEPERTGRPAGVPRLVGELEAVVEVREAAEARMPGRISGAIVDARGRVVVTDAGLDELRVHGSGGGLLYRVRRGGPDGARLSRPCCPATGPEGRLWIRDAGNARYLGFRLGDEGAVASDAVPMAHDDSEIEAPITFDPQGRLIDVGRVVDDATGEERLVRHHLGPDGAVLEREVIPSPPADSLHVRRVDSLGRAWVHPPFGPVHLVGHSPDGGWAEAVSSRYRIRWHRPGAPATELVRQGVRGPAVTEAERRRAAERLGELLGSVAGADTLFEVPERKPPLDELVFDREGRLWVSLLVPRDSPRRADVWDADGRRRFVAEWPAGMALVRDHVTTSDALGLARDAGEERLVRIRFREAPPEEE